MLASSGEITDPCGVPVSVSDHFPSSNTPALSHFWIRRRMRRSADAMLDELDHPCFVEVVEEAPDVSIQHIVHLPLHERDQDSASSARCWLRPGRKPYEKPRKSSS